MDLVLNVAGIVLIIALIALALIIIFGAKSILSEIFDELGLNDGMNFFKKIQYNVYKLVCPSKVVENKLLAQYDYYKNGKVKRECSSCSYFNYRECKIKNIDIEEDDVCEYWFFKLKG